MYLVAINVALLAIAWWQFGHAVFRGLLLVSTVP